MIRTAASAVTAVLVAAALSAPAGLAATEAPTPAEEALRVGLLVANNIGAAGRPALRYAEQDASDLASVLIQLGGFQADDVHVLRGHSLRDVLAALVDLKRQIADSQSRGTRVVVLFYFSGHSDGQALELGAERWPFADVRRDLHALGADIRIEIIDSCQSGGLLTEKGGSLVPRSTSVSPTISPPRARRC